MELFLIFLVLSLILCFMIKFQISLTMYKYLTKKPLGLQSVLDLLILDMLPVSFFNRTFFTFAFLLPGSLYGQLDFYLAQGIVFVLINGRIYLCVLFQNYLFVKAILIFRGHWLNRSSLPLTLLFTNFSTRWPSELLVIRFFSFSQLTAASNQNKYKIRPSVVRMVN